MYDRIISVVCVMEVAAFVCICANVVVAQVVTDGLVSYWTFDKADIEAGTVKDVWGSNDGSISGDPKIVEGKIGNAIEFDGDDGVDCGLDDSLLLGDTDLSFGLWFSFDNIADKNYLIGNFSTQNGQYYHIWGDSGKLVWSIDDNIVKSQLQSSTTIEVGKWYHAVGVREKGKEIKLYVNGVLEASGADQTGDITSDAPMYFGDRSAGERGLEGRIDEVALYNRALSDDEILRNYEVKKGMPVEPAGKLSLTWGRIKTSL